MIVLDTSVVVSAAVSWHRFHDVAVEAIADRKTRLLAPVAAEAYSVLTRLPSPLRVDPASVVEHFDDSFAGPVAALQPGELTRVLREAAGKKILGGAVYDAIVAATARSLGATLLSLDGRAARTYDLLGVDYRLVA